MKNKVLIIAIITIISFVSVIIIKNYLKNNNTAEACPINFTQETKPCE